MKNNYDILYRSDTRLYSDNHDAVLFRKISVIGLVLPCILFAVGTAVGWGSSILLFNGYETVYDAMMKTGIFLAAAGLFFVSPLSYLIGMIFAVKSGIRLLIRKSILYFSVSGIISCLLYQIVMYFGQF